MRLLYTPTIKLVEFDDHNIPLYSILSHTWSDNEVSFQDMTLERAETLVGYDKIKNACWVAAAAGFKYIWVDTCCIDKTSSAELSEAINSMFRYYQQAEVCFAYLADVTWFVSLQGLVESDQRRILAKSRWFTRGWTLQELIAPSSMVFLNEKWLPVGTKSSLINSLSNITGIPAGILLGGDLYMASIAQRMSWASKRETTRVEDMAYCLLGIFDINMPLLYGEGGRAFLRLQEEIMKISDDYSLFAWRSTPRSPAMDARAYMGGFLDVDQGLLASSPAMFVRSGNIVRLRPFHAFASHPRPLTVSNKGVHMTVPFKSLNGQNWDYAILNCTEGGSDEITSCYAIFVMSVSLGQNYFERHQCDRLELINLNEGIGPTSYQFKDICVKRRNVMTRQTDWWQQELKEDSEFREKWVVDAIIAANARRQQGL